MDCTDNKGRGQKRIQEDQSKVLNQGYCGGVGMGTYQLNNEVGCFHLAGYWKQHHPKIQNSKLLDSWKILFTHLRFFNNHNPLKFTGLQKRKEKTQETIQQQNSIQD